MDSSSPAGIITFHMRAKTVDKLVNFECLNPLLKRKCGSSDTGPQPSSLPQNFHTLCLSGTEEPGKPPIDFWTELEEEAKIKTSKYYISKKETINSKFQSEFQKYGPHITKLFVDELSHFKFLRKNKDALMTQLKNLKTISYTKCRKNPLNKEDEFPKVLINFIRSLPKPEKINEVEIHGVKFTDRNLHVFPKILFEKNPTIQRLIYRCPEPEGFEIIPETTGAFLKRDSRIILLGSYGWEESDDTSIIGVHYETNSSDGHTFNHIDTFQPGEEKRHQGHPHFHLMHFKESEHIPLVKKLIKELASTTKSIFFPPYQYPEESKRIFKSQKWKQLINLRIEYWENDDFGWLKANAPKLESLSLGMVFGKHLFPDCPTPSSRLDKIKRIFDGFNKLKVLHLTEQGEPGFIDEPIIQWLKSKYEKVTYSDITDKIYAVANDRIKYI